MLLAQSEKKHILDCTQRGSTFEIEIVSVAEIVVSSSEMKICVDPGIELFVSFISFVALYQQYRSEKGACADKILGTGNQEKNRNR